MLKSINKFEKSFSAPPPTKSLFTYTPELKQDPKEREEALSRLKEKFQFKLVLLGDGNVGKTVFFLFLI